MYKRLVLVNTLAILVFTTLLGGGRSMKVVLTMSSAFRLAILYLQENLSQALAQSWVFFQPWYSILCILNNTGAAIILYYYIQEIFFFYFFFRCYMISSLLTSSFHLLQ